VIAVVLGASTLTSCSSTSDQAQQYSATRSSGIESLAGMERNTYVNGPLSSKGGPFITDRFGRIVTLHGVNAVYKRAPYTLTVQPGRPNTLGTQDAARIAALGFNVVRLGVIWAGLEPGTGGPNQPAICTPGTPHDPGMWNQQTATAYLAQVQKVVDELGRHHIYSLIDMHQDIYSSVFSGEGAPAWAVCTSGNPVVVYPGRWSNNYSNPAVDASFQNFFNNSVVGGPQNENQRAWTAVATQLRSDPWVVGYDPMNEPLSLQASRLDTGDKGRVYAIGLSCLYAGSGGDAQEIGTGDTLSCPKTVPSQGLIELLLSIDPNHLVFPEIDNATDHGKTLFVATSTDLTRVVYNFHDYCPQRSGVTGNPTSLESCSDTELVQMIRQEQLRPLYKNVTQPQGPAIMMTEFGATSDPTLADMLVLDASTLGLSWAWWSWRYYDDPTGSSAEAVISAENRYSPIVGALTHTHVVAVAGSLLTAQFGQATGDFTMVYVSNTSIAAPTTIFVTPTSPKIGYCAYVKGARITSKPGAAYLTIDNTSQGATVVVRIEPGHCVSSL